MPVYDQRSPCAADALFSLRQVVVRGKTVGITGLSDAIATVRGQNLSGDRQIILALLGEVEKVNFIPGPLREEYGIALLEEYRAAMKRAAEKFSPGMKY